MAKNGETAFTFINEMHDKIKSAYKAEIKRQEEFVSQKTGEPRLRLNSWDTAYWNQKMCKEFYQFDPEELRPYFSLENVLNGMFTIMGKLYGIRVTKRTKNKPPVWHPEVNFYDVVDTETKELLGSFYTDWFPRSSKQSGAWMNGFIVGDRTEKKRTPHLGLMSGNLTPPTGSKPVLLTHSEVETIFHEFGHLLHLLLSDVEVKSLAGTNVPRDFVEFPSKMNENWCWEREALDIFARHYKTGKRIPQELFEKMVQSRNFGMASFLMHQLKLGMLDISLHYKYEELKDLDIDEAARVFTKEYEPLVADEILPMIANFSHLFENPVGYASGYYSYKWAEVLDADAFSRFKDEGVLNESTGRHFRSAVLSKGNSEDPEKIYHNFMGRSPNSNALLRRLGLIQGS